MSPSPVSMNSVPSGCMLEGKRASEVAQLVSRLGHPRVEITQAYVGTLRAHGVLPQRSSSEAPTGNVA